MKYKMIGSKDYKYFKTNVSNNIQLFGFSTTLCLFQSVLMHKPLKTMFRVVSSGNYTGEPLSEQLN